MISSEFVNIAREVIKFVKKGHKLRGFNIRFIENACCPLGAVCVNHNLIPDYYNIQDCYSFAQSLIKLENDFKWGFDDFCDSMNMNPKLCKQEDYVIGYNLAKMASKRGWIVA